MTAMPVPARPSRAFISAAQEVSTRSGITVYVERQPNVCRWAVHSLEASGAPVISAGPKRGQPWNPSNSELAAQLEAAIGEMGHVDAEIFVPDWATAEMMRTKTSLKVSDRSAPPHAVVAAREAVQDVEKIIVSGLTLACDASRGRGTNINGCGWVLTYGCGADAVVGSGTSVSAYGGIRAGELDAILRGLRAALKAHPSLGCGMGQIKVLTDSKAALALLEQVRSNQDLPATADDDSVRDCRRILALTEDMNVAFEWVRGHNGHALNEFADRLAVMARRNREMGVDELTHARMISRIRTEVREALSE